MGKKKKRLEENYSFDLDEEFGGTDCDFEKSFWGNDEANEDSYGFDLDSYEDDEDYFGFEENNVGGFEDMITVDTSNSGSKFGNELGSPFKPVNNMMFRMWPKDISEKEMKKALKKVKKSEELGNDALASEGIKREYYLLKEGKTLTKKELDLVTRINALRLVQNNTIIKIIAEAETPDIIEKIKRDYKVYECDYTDSRVGSMALKNEDFLKYIKEHKITELFLGKEKCMYISDYENSDTSGYKELEKDIKTYKKLAKKLTDNVASYYMLSCFVDGLLIRTRVETKFASTVNLWDEVYGLHKDEVTGIKNSFGNNGFSSM